MRREDGFGTIEVVIILAILVSLAVLFKSEITTFFDKQLDFITNTDFTSQSYIRY